MQRFFLVLALAATLALGALQATAVAQDAAQPAAVSAGAAEAPSTSAEAAPASETLFQVSTISALLAGVYDGVMSFGELAAYGDTGIGTFHGLEGEMVAVDGAFYQVKVDGKAYPVAPETTTPFATVSFFRPELFLKLEQVKDLDDLTAQLDKALPNPNLFYAIRLDGGFDYVKTRSVPGQQKPYPPLAEVVKEQAVFDFKQAEGTVVGYYCPALAAKINVPGYHFHFLTQDKTGGGHILDIEARGMVAAIDTLSTFTMQLDREGDGAGVDYTKDTSKELHAVEKEPAKQ